MIKIIFSGFRITQNFRQCLSCVRGGGQPSGCSEGLTSLGAGQSLSRLRRQLPAGNPVAALTAHRAVIHYRDCASLTLYTREPWFAAPFHSSNSNLSSGFGTNLQGVSKGEATVQSVVLKSWFASPFGRLGSLRTVRKVLSCFFAYFLVSTRKYGPRQGTHFQRSDR